MRVFVINKHGEPMMPCSPRKARALLKEDKAVVVSREPFTIQLKYGSSGYKQKIVVGVDTGHSEVGVSVLTKTKELSSYVFKMRNDISKKMTHRAIYRRNRRGRLRYRKPRFNNRSASTRKGRLAPSVQWKVDAHIRIITLVSNRLPSSTLILETGSFDTQKLANPNITNKMYQKGAMYNYSNTKAYVLTRDNYTCQSKGKGCTDRLEVHHIEFRSNGGADNPSNLITLCSKHHKMLHEGKLSLNIKRHKSMGAATAMSIIRKKLLVYYPNVVETFGYITKQNRQELGLDKSHENDAFVIAGGTNQERSITQNWGFKRSNVRDIGINRKGFAPTARKVRYPIQSKDIVEFEGKQYVSKGNNNKGKTIWIVVNDKKKGVLSKKINLVYSRKNIINQGVSYFPRTYSKAGKCVSVAVLCIMN